MSMKPCPKIEKFIVPGSGTCELLKENNNIQMIRHLFNFASIFSRKILNAFCYFYCCVILVWRGGGGLHFSKDEISIYQSIQMIITNLPTDH